MDKNIAQKIDSIFSVWNQGVCPGGQVLVRIDGDIIYRKNFGYANLEHKIPITDNTVFHVASVSKQITVMCILLLSKEGKISIDDDIRKYVPDLIQFIEPVTIRNLMNNVSGIRDQWELLFLSGTRIVDTITQEDAITMIKSQKELNFEPLTKFSYSNSNFTLLAEIIERITGKSLDEFASERIFKPLKMNQTQFKNYYSKVIENRANSYFDNGYKSYSNSVLNYGTYGATSLNTTVNDFLKWMDNYSNPVIGGKDLIEIMQTVPNLKSDEKTNYGGGLFIGEYKGHNYFEHGGADASFRSQMMRFTEDDLDIILFSNTQNISLKQAALKIADVFFNFNEKTVDDTKYTKEMSDLTNLGGLYFCKDFMFAIEIHIKDEKPHIEVRDKFVPLEHVKGNHYLIKHMNLNIYFGDETYIQAQNNFFEMKRITPYKIIEDESTYPGSYFSEELDTTYKIVQVNEYLYLSHRRNGKHPLFKIEENKFFCDGLSVTIKFIHESGKIAGLLMDGGRVNSINFERINIEQSLVKD